VTAPFVVPEPLTDDTVGRESLWYEYGAGADRAVIPPWLLAEIPDMAAHDDLVPAGLVRYREPLPYGAADLLDAAPYPYGRAAVDGDPLPHALAAAFAPQWYDLDNAFNPHRGYASGRCLYPVQALLDDGDRWWLVEPDRHALGDLGVPGTARRLALTGRYTRIPRGYRWFRGSLVNAETGIALRHLAVVLGRFGIAADVRLPEAGSLDLLAGLGLRPTAEWSLPMILGLGGPDSHTERCDDPVLADVLRVNRLQANAGPPAPLGSGLPAGADPGLQRRSWAEVLWERNSGRMPRGLYGFSGRLRRLPAAAADDAARWLAVPPPDGVLRQVFDLFRFTVVLQDVDGYPDGVHRIGPDGTLEPVRLARGVAAELEKHYGYPLTGHNGCDVRHASMLWFLSVRPRELFARSGPTGWTAAQYAAGWAIHGLSLSATAFDLFARPVRAFGENPSRPLLGLGDDEMIALAAVVGTAKQPSGLLLDIRL